MKQKGIKRRIAPSFLPPAAVLEMTYRCNHSCIFCSCPWYADGNGFEIQKELNVDEWKALIRKICEMGVCKIGFTGGESLLKKGIVEINEFAASCTVEHIETKNGNLLTRRGPPNLYLLSNGKVITTEITQMLDIAEEVLRTANRNGSIGTELPKCLVDENKYKNLKVGTRCSAALDFFVIDPSGYIRVCNHSPVRLNHISEIEKVKEHPYWKSFVMKDYFPDFCIGCQFMTNCDGGCREAAHITGGSIDSVDPALDYSTTENSCTLCPILN